MRAAAAGAGAAVAHTGASSAAGAERSQRSGSEPPSATSLLRGERCVCACASQLVSLHRRLEAVEARLLQLGCTAEAGTPPTAAAATVAPELPRADGAPSARSRKRKRRRERAEAARAAHVASAAASAASAAVDGALAAPAPAAGAAREPAAARRSASGWTLPESRLVAWETARTLDARYSLLVRESQLSPVED
jgi:hypothetical protein